jgi:ribonuclease BN (tRNA processing enzyme)/energy-coupling factor transporter ATP-binding protein EcfA2
MRGDPTESLPCAPDLLVARLLSRDRRVLLLGPTGSGKTTLAAALASILDARGRPVSCLAADPGSPAFGVPGALCLGDWRDGVWSPRSIEALCTLDAARFRLPLISAVRALAREATSGTLLVDAPGVVRGVAGAELLQPLVEAASIDLVLVLSREGQPLPLAQELRSLEVELALVRASDQARRPGEAARARGRTRLWDRFLADGEEWTLSLDEQTLLGTPPRRAQEAWLGKQLAFLEGGRTRAMGEVLGLDGTALRVRLPPGQTPTGTLLVRDACRGGDGLLGTAKPFAAELVRYVPPPDVLADGLAAKETGVRPVIQVGTAVACLTNGVFGDPMLHLRLRHQRRSLLFDLGEGARLPARIAHQVTDCFITHAHADHIGGFLWLLRSRIGEDVACRLFGPPGLAGHVQGFIDGILWDRIGDRGPVFEVAEVHGGQLRRFRLQAGLPEPISLDEVPVRDSVLLEEPGFRVRCALLDHGTPVLAYAFAQALKVQVRKERLDQRGLEPGPWLTGLKQRILKGDYGAEIALPDGRRQTVAELAADLTLTGPGGTLVYATDLADTPENRRRLVDLAHGAQCLLCEASFLDQDRAQAERTGHLTTRACGEIAVAAGVRYLVPFHFSRRYESEPWRVYEEIAAVCPQVVIPKG